METKKLKIGNYVYGTKGSPSVQSLVRVDNVSDDGINYNDTDNTYQYTAAQLSEIPLTADIILLSDFTLSGNRYRNNKIGFVKLIKINGTWMWFGQESRMIPIRSLSELQNFYTEMTGNILVVDEEGLAAELSKLIALLQPEGLVASNIAQITATVSWNAVTGADGYKYSMNAGVSWSDLIEDTEVDLTGLTHDTDYVIRVKAIGDTVVYSDSPVSEELAFSTLDLEVLATPVPVASAQTQTTATVTWGANAKAEGFKYAIDGGAQSALITENHIDLTGLTADTEYSIVVQAIGDGASYDDSVASEALVFSTLELEVLATPSNLSESAVTQTTATVSWDANENAEGFKYSLNAGSTWSDILTSPTVDLTDLTAGTEYSVTVKAIGDGIVYDDSLVSDPLVFSTLELEVLDTPEAAVTAFDDISITVGWGAVDNAEGYTITWGEALTQDVLSDVLTYKIEGLSANTEYSITVKALGDGIVSDDSLAAEVLQTTDKIQLDTPVISGDALSSSSVKFSWAAIDNASGYKYSTDEGANWTDTALLEITLTDLTPSTSYTMLVKAIAFVESNYRDSDSGSGSVSTNA